MADRLIVDLNPDGTAVVSVHRDGDDLASPGPVFDLAWPLDADALEDLRFYLEDYLRLPSAVYGERGQKTQARLVDWGTTLFSAVFGAGPARDAYMRLRDRPTGTHLVFRSPDPRLLALPWELIRDPDRRSPLALDLAGISRSLPTGRLADTIGVPGGRLRVLMVIARPEGEADVGYQMIARPLLERLHAVRSQVDLVVLRPPTLEALEEALVQASVEGVPFHVVHFDGHGIQNERWVPASGPRESFGEQPGEGVFLFEKPGGGPNPVSASTIARILTSAKVPVVVLNACQSGAIGKNLEAAIATRLLQEGTASVVGMAYSVYAVAAAEFMAAFYERLFTGDPVSAAVTAGRKRMATRNGRPSRKGDLPLEDWLIPVHYVRRDVSFPQAVTPRTGPLSLDDELDRISTIADGQGAADLDPVGSFIGRDWLTCQLETAARVQKVVVLHGPGGTGKTELAKAFGRWWRDTGGVDDPRYVFFHSFESGFATFGLDAVVNEIGRELFSHDKFDRLEPSERRGAVERVLSEHRMLLIWDNFETVRSMPDPNPLGENDCQQLREFLTRLAGHGTSTVLITSRSPETWLGDVRRLTVGGLAQTEADEYATSLLEPYPAARTRRRRPAFADLMEWLDGHPMSMRLILPHLESSEPDVLLSALRGTTPLPGLEGDDTGRLTSLPVSIAYSYAHLTTQTRLLLPAISLFQRVADDTILDAFSRIPCVPGRFRSATKAQWRGALNEAAEVGLLSRLWVGIYLMHPSLPAYLSALWRDEEPAGHEATREAAMRALLVACAACGNWLVRQMASGEAMRAYSVLDLHRRTFGSMLRYALALELWEQAEAIFGPLGLYCSARDLIEEADTWTDQVLLATEDVRGTPSEIESPIGSLWLAAAIRQANRQCDRFQLNLAESTYWRIYALLDAAPSSPSQQLGLISIRTQFGVVAHRRGRLDDAEEWYRKALAISEQIGNKAGTAGTFHLLGLVARDRNYLDQAENFFRRSVAIQEEFSSSAEFAVSYRELGSIAYLLGRPDEAAAWYRKALEINKKLCSKAGTAATCYELGMSVRRWGRPDEAEEWCREALAIWEELGDKVGLATTYHELGVIALIRDRLNDAEKWFREALAIWEELGDESSMAKAFGSIGLLAGKRGQLDQAFEWTVRCVTVREEFPHPTTQPGPMNLVAFAKTLGIGVLEETWRSVTGKPLPQAVREYVESGGQHAG